MSAALAKPSTIDELAIESLVLKGDVSALGPRERIEYYRAICERVGVDPMTKPFDIIRLKGKDVMYANRSCTDQLARRYGISRRIVRGPEVVDIGGQKLVMCTCEASTADGRTDTSVATVPLTDVENAFMRCETKSKRRAVLSLCGLGLLDESEVADIPASAKVSVHTIEIEEPVPQLLQDNEPAAKPPLLEDFPQVTTVLHVLAQCQSPRDVARVWRDHKDRIRQAPQNLRALCWRSAFRRVAALDLTIIDAATWLRTAVAELEQPAEAGAA